MVIVTYRDATAIGKSLAHTNWQMVADCEFTNSHLVTCQHSTSKNTTKDLMTVMKQLLYKEQENHRMVQCGSKLVI